MKTQRWMQGIFVLVLLAMVWLVAGCSTMQAMPKPSEEKPTSDKALIIVERSSSLYAWIWKTNVYDNNEFVGKLGIGGKMAWLRTPGTMDLQFFGLGMYGENKALGGLFLNKGRSLAVEAGKIYRYKIHPGGWDIPGFYIDGPGIPLEDVMTPQFARETSTDPLVFFRFFPDRDGGVITLMNINTGKVIEFPGSLLKKHNHWVALYLPIGEYMVVKHEYSINEINKSTKLTYRINATIVVTMQNSGMYIGDLVFVENGWQIIKNSDAARAFIEQNGKGLPYTESLMRFNQ